jgi:hypothetical protein
MKTIALCVIVLCAIAVPARGQELPPKGPIIRLQIVIERFNNDKKVSSAPYVMSLTPFPLNRAPGSLGLLGRVRVGVQVPIVTKTQDSSIPTTVYRDVGTFADCRAEPREDGRYLVQCTLEQSSVFIPPATSTQKAIARTGTAPVIRSFKSDAVLLIGDGQTGQHSAGVDPTTGEQVKVDITLNVMN